MNKKWFCSRINISSPTFNGIVPILDECEDIEKHNYKVEQIIYINGQYQIFYSREETEKLNTIEEDN